MDAVLAFVPEEERVQYSALTGQSLFYMQDRTWRTRSWRWSRKRAPSERATP